MTRSEPFVQDIYHQRFTAAEVERKNAIWIEIGRYLQRFIPRDAVVLDLACDRGDFIRNISCREKWATDLRDVSEELPDDVRFVAADGLELAGVLPEHHFDVVFMSNYLEHLATNDDVIQQFRVVRRLLKPNGKVIVLQPNIRLVGGRYWDFIDHSVALTERSLVEAAELGGFRSEKVITRFLPYTTKSRFPGSSRLVRAYLALPFVWWFLGKQTLYVGVPASPVAGEARS
ncbi:MAG: class I SAM-dependent methyltransferase [Thermoanaerobaculia bacterium]